MVGGVIPAHPLALTKDRRLDAPRQRLLTRYYVEAGVAGVAVGVHTTQFAIRDPEHDLLASAICVHINQRKIKLATAYLNWRPTTGKHLIVPYLH